MIPDSTIDMLVVMFGANSRIAAVDGGGYTGIQNERLKSKRVRHLALFQSSSNKHDLISHESAHKLIGNNHYRTGGSGAGLEGEVKKILHQCHRHVSQGGGN